MADGYPLGFYFRVVFDNADKDGDGKIQDASFQSVSGLSVDVQTEDIAEGGENRFQHALPVRKQYPNLVLKRGLTTNSKLTEWCRKAVEDFDFEPTDLLVELLNEEGEPLMSWNVLHAYPVKWSVDDLNAQESKIVIESIELSYNYFNVIK
ncbi:phage tail protein [Cytophagaceae bacterium ABcell3]|nr:phage tail protein [Cytophagaceae bacterium ABcell3]